MSRKRVVCLGLFFFLSLSSCAVYHVEKIRFFEVEASSEEGRKFIQEYSVKYLCKSYGAFWTDIVRTNCEYATDIKRTEKNNIQYRIINDEYKMKFGFKPKMTWWESNGRWVFLAIVAAFILWIVIDRK